MPDVHPVRPWFLNQVPLIPIGTAIEGLFCHSIHRAFLEAYGTESSRLNSRISNPVRSKPPGQSRATLAGTRCSRATSLNQRSHWLGTTKPHFRCGCEEWFVQVRRCGGIGRLMSQNRPARGSTEATHKDCERWQGKRASLMSGSGCYPLLPASTNWRIGQNGGRRSASKPLIEQGFSGRNRIISDHENHELHP